MAHMTHQEFLDKMPTLSTTPKDKLSPQFQDVTDMDSDTVVDMNKARIRLRKSPKQIDT